MAQRKKVTTARRSGATSKQRKPLAKATLRKTTKRPAARAGAKTRATKVGSKRAAQKRRVPARTPRKPAAVAPADTLVVDLIEEPVPGLVIITEFETVVEGGSEAVIDELEDEVVGLPPDEEQEPAGTPD